MSTKVAPTNSNKVNVTSGSLNINNVTSSPLQRNDDVDRLVDDELAMVSKPNTKDDEMYEGGEGEAV